jgi:hypothetical protein
MKMSKDTFLNQLKTHIPADDYIMVGNIKGVSGGSDDEGAANLARWRFIRESDFAAGARDREKRAKSNEIVKKTH